MRRGARATLAAAIAALGAFAVPSVAHADAAGPTDYVTEIVAIDGTPPGDDRSGPAGLVTVSIEGGDSFVRVSVAPGHEVIVLGYAGEHYLRIDAAGDVFHNSRSYATYYNEDRYGSDDIPDHVDNEAAPEWERIGRGGDWSWHDHRAHFMGTARPIGMEPGDSFPIQVVPLLVDGVLVDVEVRTTLQPHPAWLPPAFGALIGLQVILLAGLAGPATTVIGGFIVGGFALLAGLAQYLSLPPETGPLVTWWLLPVLALVCLVATVASYGRSALIERGLVALSGLLVVVWAFERRSGLTRAVIPSELPAWFDRMVTAGALAGGATIVVLAVRDLFGRPPG